MALPGGEGYGHPIIDHKPQETRSRFYCLLEPFPFVSSVIEENRPWILNLLDKLFDHQLPSPGRGAPVDKPVIVLMKRGPKTEHLFSPAPFFSPYAIPSRSQGAQARGLSKARIGDEGCLQGNDAHFLEEPKGESGYEVRGTEPV